jgi:hypothetical protein
LGPIDLSAIPALQNVTASNTVTFRIVNWGGTNSGGTWYVFDVANSSAPDLAVQGVVSSAVTLTPVQAWRLLWFGSTANSGAGADSAIAAGDGIPNLLKYAFGLNPPQLKTNNPVIYDITTGYLRLTSPKNTNATDVSFHVQATGALTNSWSTNGPVVDQNSAALLQVHDGTPVLSAPSRFLRLRVTQP